MNFKVRAANDHRNQVKALQNLTGICSGLVCDGRLNDDEIQYLRIWLLDHPGLTDCWPGSVITARIAEVMRDGVITEEERKYLLSTLEQICGTEFTETGSAAPGAPAVPVQDDAEVAFDLKTYCFTGTFIFGTRAACERVVLSRGATAVDNVSRKLDYLVVGTMITPDWQQTTYGRKIIRAMELREEGHPLCIVSEKRWSAALAP